MKMDKALKIVEEAIEVVRGDVSIGDVVAHPNDPITYKLAEIKDSVAICTLPDGTRKEYPVSEIFDVNKANYYIQLRKAKLIIFRRP